MRSLEEIRKEIDKIDKQIIELIKDRSQIIKEVKEIKKDQKVKIKFAREAEIINNISKIDVGLYQNKTIARMWRELIMGTLMIEGEFIISTSHKDYKSISIIRDHFGIISQLNIENSEQEVIKKIDTDEATVGILNLNNNNWQNLPQNILITAILPFIGKTNVYDSNFTMYVISKAKIEYVNEITNYVYAVENEIKGANILAKSETQYLIGTKEQLKEQQLIGLIHLPIYY